MRISFAKVSHNICPCLAKDIPDLFVTGNFIVQAGYISLMQNNALQCRQQTGLQYTLLITVHCSVVYNSAVEYNVFTPANFTLGTQRLATRAKQWTLFCNIQSKYLLRCSLNVTVKWNVKCSVKCILKCRAIKLIFVRKHNG